jgi:hypothetical protein
MIGLTTTVTVVRWVAGDRDDEGRLSGTFVDGDTVPASVFEQGTRELVGAQWTTVQSWKALLPATVQVTHRDVLRTADGREYRVETVTPRRGPNGQIHHVTCQLRAVEVPS